MPELKVRAQQLRRPEGDLGISMAEMMNKGNELMCRNTYSRSTIGKGHRILEIGMGNGFFVPELFKMAEDLTYVGFDYSKLMVDKASELNTSYIASGRASFVHGSVDALPFETNSFDRICTSNTLYFWPSPADNMKALTNVLKPGGRILIAIRPKDIMLKMKVTQYDFTLYTLAETALLMESAGLNIINAETIDEPDRTLGGETYELKSTYVLAEK